MQQAIKHPIKVNHIRFNPRAGTISYELRLLVGGCATTVISSASLQSRPHNMTAAIWLVLRHAFALLSELEAAPA